MKLRLIRRRKSDNSDFIRLKINRQLKTRIRKRTFQNSGLRSARDISNRGLQRQIRRIRARHARPDERDASRPSHPPAELYGRPDHARWRGAGHRVPQGVGGDAGLGHFPQTEATGRSRQASLETKTAIDLIFR